MEGDLEGVLDLVGVVLGGEAGVGSGEGALRMTTGSSTANRPLISEALGGIFGGPN